MTKRHFEAFAKRIKADMDYAKTCTPNSLTQTNIYLNAQYAADLFASLATEDNPRFDRDRFLTACGLR